MTAEIEVEDRATIEEILKWFLEIRFKQIKHRKGEHRLTLLFMQVVDMEGVITTRRPKVGG